MAKSGLFFGWTRAAVGREAAALEHFTSSMAWLGKQQAAGRIDSFEPVILQQHGGDLNGFVLVRGDHDKLEALKRTDEFRDLIVKSAVLLQGHGVLDAVIGEELQAEMGRFGKVLQQIR